MTKTKAEHDELKRLWEGTSRYVPAMGKVILVVNGDDSLTTLQILRDGCIIFSPRTVFSNCFYAPNPSYQNVARLLREDAKWYACSGLLLSSRSLVDAFIKVADCVGVTEVGLVVLSEESRDELLRNFSRKSRSLLEAPAPRGKSNLVLLNLDSANNLIGVERYHPSEN